MKTDSVSCDLVAPGDALTAREAREFRASMTVRQYHHGTMYDDAVVTCVHGNGALDVTGTDGVRYGWSESVCEIIDRPASSIAAGAKKQNLPLNLSVNLSLG